MGNWKLLNELEYKRVWDFVYNTLFFHPHKADEKITNLPTPNKCYDVSGFYNNNFSEDMYNNLNETTIKCFQMISKGKKMYALNWQHDCYSFSPEIPFEKDEFDEWFIPIFPNGDYCFFLTKDLGNGIFADGINLSVCLFGEDIIKAFDLNRPLMLSKMKNL